MNFNRDKGIMTLQFTVTLVCVAGIVNAFEGNELLATGLIMLGVANFSFGLFRLFDFIEKVAKQ